jgi:amino acid adenylation domain-containing protein/non-ribosomal peptide synthase protein (TIGR01720 family)
MSGTMESTGPGLTDKRRRLIERLLRQEGVASAGYERIPRRQPGDSVPLFPGQRRLWFLHQIEEQGAAYHIAEAVRLQGNLDVRALAHALAEVVRRHEVLRSAFVAGAGGQPVQQVHERVDLRLPRIELGGIGASQQGNESRRIASQITAWPFDLAFAPLLRAALLCLDTDDHVLVLVMHHIVSDGWSIGILVRELTILYRAFAAGRPSPLPELPIQYPDFAVWQEKRLRDELLEPHLRFWRERLAGATAPLEFPTDRPRSVTPGTRGAGEKFGVDRESAMTLRELALRYEATPFMVVVAGLGALLQRYSHQDRVTLGSPFANRSRPETEGLIGLFLNVVVLPVEMAKDPDVDTLLRRVRQIVLDVEAHQELPFERLIEALEIPRDPSRTPLFQVALAFQNLPGGGEGQLGPLRLSAFPLEANTAQYELYFAFTDGEDGLQGHLRYRTDLFDSSTARRLGRHLEALLREFSRQPGRRLSELSLLSTAEVSQILNEWNDTGAALPEICLHELIAEHAARAPHTPAIHFADRWVSYGELNLRANQLARHLALLGVGPEVLVAICMDRSPEMIVGLLAVLKAGGAYLPLDPSYPPERLSFMFEDSGAMVLLTEDKLLEVLPSRWGFTLCLDTEWGLVAGCDDADFPNPACPDNPAYVIYTSGSTGKPKAVQVTHRGLTNLAEAEMRLFAAGPGSRVLQFASLSFDASVFEIAMALRTGATLYLADRETLMPGPGLLDLLRREQISHVTLPPSALAATPVVPLPELESVVVAGEACPPDLLSGWAAGRRFYNAYGPSETAVWATVELCSPESGKPLIGRPIDNARAYVLGPYCEVVPIGVPGELYLGGPGLARGYLGQPALTAARFVPNPWGEERGARLYRTGDLALLRADGRLEFLGRVDQQVKLRGFRIELEEIEAVLRGEPAVHDAVAALREDGRGEKRLVAYIVSAEGLPLSPPDLLAGLRLRLPEHMVPALFVPLDALPLTPSGKVDRRALPAAEDVRVASRTSRPVMLNPFEEVISGIWSDILGAGPIGPDDSFFDLGGHSLLATQVLSRITGAFGVELAIGDLFAEPTVAGLARLVESSLEVGVRSVLPPVVPVPRNRDLPLSFAQQRLWFIDQLEPGGSAYNLPLSITLRGAVDVPALAASLSAVVARHEVLRTIFGSRQGQPLQLIAPPGRGMPLPFVDLSSLPHERRRPAAYGLIKEVTARPFDLVRGPLLRAALLKVGDDHHFGVFTLHHIVADGWSLGVLVRDLGAFFAAQVRGELPELPPLPVQYADFAVWQREWLSGAALERQLAYWRDHLQGAPALLDLPLDRPRPAVRSLRGARVPVRLDQEVVSRLTALGRAHGATFFMVLLAGFESLLARLSGQDDLVVGTPIANRTREETEGLIGFFVNTLALRSDIPGASGFADLVTRVRETTLGAYAHQDLPFERLVDELQLARSLAHAPLFQVVLALESATEDRLDLPDVKVEMIPVELGRAKFDLTLAVTHAGSYLGGSCEYNADSLDAVTVARWVEHWSILLAAAASEPERRLSELNLLSPAQHSQLALEWNPWCAVAASTFCLHERFEIRAADEPSAVAVSWGGKELTYGQLNRAANRLARRLLAVGVEPDGLVGICLERSLDLVVGILGVLKAGCGYMPIDPAYPEGRIAYLLQDSHVPVLITVSALAERLPEQAAKTVCLDQEGEEGSGGDEDLKLPITPGQLAYAIYTSGSTGKPKGVLVSHHNVARLLATCEPWLGFTARDVWTLFHSYAFDFSVWELWGALLYGGRLVVVPQDVSRSPGDFLALLRREGVTVLNQTPSAFQQLLPLILEAGSEGPMLPALRLVIFGGEALDLQALAPWFGRHGSARPRMVNMYGITETTVHVTYRPLSVSDLSGAVTSPIGQPLSDLSLRLFDPALRPVPIGVVGEIYVGGEGLARGYLGRQDLTAERFVPDPIAIWSGAGGRLYRSGDLARYLANGELEYRGRIDHQVKIRGFRIELSEIEASLAEHPRVGQAVVTARGAETRDLRLIAYVVRRTGAEPPISDELRSFLAARLPEHMLPAALVILDQLPLTAHGKVDRRALPDPGRERPDLERAYTAPSTVIEELLAEIWGQVLEIDRVGIDDNFFSLGGDSILSVRVVARAQELDLPLALPQLFQHQTVRALARELTFHGGGTWQESHPFSLISAADRAQVPEEIVDAYPLARLQAGMLFHSDYGERASTYHDIFSYRLRGRLSPGLLGQAISRVMARHPTLRTSFELTRFSEPLQLVHPTAPVPLSIEELRELPAERQDDLVAAWLDGERACGFDLAGPPLLRFHVHVCAGGTWQFSMSFHHAVLDGWSAASLLTELFRHYMSRLEDRPLPDLPPPAVGLRDFVRLEREAIASAETREFWQRWLDGSVFLKLPRSAAAGQPARTRELDVPILDRVSDGLRRTARQLGLPVKTLLLAAHLKVLGLASGEADVVTGLSSNGRPEQAGGDQALGLFLNNLPVRVRLGEGTWIDLARATFESERSMLPHRRYPFADIQADQGGRPLFETAFNFVHFHVYRQTREFSGLEVVDRYGYEETNFPLVVNFGLDLNGSRVFLLLIYGSSQLQRVEVQRLGDLYTRTLAAIAADPAGLHDEAGLLHEVELRQLFVEWGEGPRIDVATACLPELFERQAARTAEAPALAWRGELMSYAALNELADRVARSLCDLGIGPESRVGICMERSPEMVAALLGVLKAGAAYVPLDPTYPSDRLSFIAADAQISALLSESRLLSRLRFEVPLCLSLERGGADWGRGANPGSSPLSSADPANLAYIIYTSGSTGRPKGVMVAHAGLSNYLAWAAATYPAGLTGHRAPVHSSLGFDLTVTSLFLPLVTGGCCHLLPEDQDLNGLAAALGQGGFSMVKLTPSHLEALACLVAPEEIAGSAQAWVVGGEALSGERISAWRGAQLETPRIFNEYGPTEATVACCVHEVAAGTPPPGPVAIGRPTPNTRIRLLGSGLHPVLAGGIGELYLGGPQLARGYLGRPDLTAERFVPDPYAHINGEPGSRLYSTGDRARHLPDGNLEYLGRRDEQVKVRGFRIELGEIEAVLAQHPAVGECAVILRQGEAPDAGPTESLLMAFVVARGEKAAHRTGGLGAELDRFLRERLPAPMVPREVVELESLPLTPHGKVDRLLLARHIARPEKPESSFAAPRSATEIELAGIWSAVLRLEQVGIHDNFFSLGGDSILALQVSSRARAAGLTVNSRLLFQHPTVAELAEVAHRAAAPRSGPTPARGATPLTPIQRWFLDSDPVDPHHFNQSLLLAFTRRIEAPALATALTALASRHDALGLRFHRGPAGWEQRAGDATAIPLGVVDLSALAENALTAVVEQAAAEAQASLDLERGPLHRALLLDLGAHRPGRFFWAVHHLVVDGVSWRILLEELETVYSQLASGQPVDLPAGANSFTTWAQRLSEHARSLVLEPELSWWLRELQPASHLALDFPAGDNTVASARSVSLFLEAEETQALLHEVPRAYRTQINDVLLTALAQACAGSARELQIELEGHGREEILPGDEIDLARTVGWFTTLFPVRLTVGSRAEWERSPGTALKAVKEHLRAIPRKGIGYGLLRYLRQDDPAVRELASLPRPALSFNYLGQFDQAVSENPLLRMAGEASGPARSPRARRSHVLEVGGMVVGGRLRMDWRYSENLHERASIVALSSRFADCLRALISHCRALEIEGGTPSDFPLAGLDQGRLDAVLHGRPVDDIYPLSPLQHGLLFHSVDPQESGTYFRQLSCTVRGPLDVELFERTCADLLERHPILRTTFAWQGLDEPLQVVLRRAVLPLTTEDWRPLAATEQGERLAAFRREDRQRGFALAAAPLMRFALFRIEDEAWALVWSFHHLISDGWSFSRLVAELFAGYEARLGGRSAVGKRPQPFRDYIAWLRQQDLGAAELFWRRTLAGFAAATPLAPDREPRSGDETPRIGERRISLSAPATAALEAWARAHQLTLNTAVQGAWALLLSRTSGDQDVVFGTVTSGRSAPLAGIDSMLGIFINTLPVRVETVADMPLLDWLRGLQGRQAEAREFEYSPLVQVQGWSEVPRGQPLFQSLTAFENYPVDESIGGGQTFSLRVEQVDFPEETNYPLTLMTGPGARMAVRLSFDRRRFDESTAERRLRHFEALLAGFAEHRGSLADLPMLTAAERQQILWEWNDTAREDGSSPLIHQLFEQQAARQPDRVAAVFEDASLSYGQLNVASNQLGRLLRALDLGPGDLVAIYLDRSLEMVPAVLGVLKAGAAYVPLDAEYPRARLRWILGGLSIRCLITQSSRMPQLADLDLPALTHVICMDADGAAAAVRDAGLPERRMWSSGDLAGQAGEDLPPANSPEDRAYIIFTSGSTGNPKGVTLRHRPVVNVLRWVNETFGVGGSDRLLFITSLCFDLSVYDIFGILAAGGALRIAAKWQVEDPQTLARMLREEPITFWDSAPAALERLTPWLDPRGGGPARLRLVLLSGDWIPVSLPDQVRQAFPAARVVALGGATEAAIWSNFFPIAEVAPQWPSIPYGRPIRNARYHVLDHRLDPGPIGVAGDLYIAGGCLASGYAGEPGLTGERFLPDPFSSGAGASMYWTGDRARYLADGNLEFLGRMDRQVKVRGFRIELGEVEAALAGLAGIRDAVVIVRDDLPGGRGLAAFAVPQAGAELDPGALRQALEGRLPGYMVPGAIAVLPELPLTSNGKVDRKALAQYRPASGGGNQPVDRPLPPRTPHEELVAGIFAEVFAREQIGSGDSFFDLGGHSLTATRVVSRVRELFHVDLPVRALFEQPTVTGLARAVEEMRQSGGEPAPPPIGRASRAADLPLSFAQQRLWFIEQLEPGTTSFHMPLPLRVQGRLDPLVAQWVLGEILRRHEALRTRFPALDGVPLQVVDPPGCFDLPVVDLEGLAPALRDSEALRLARQESRRLFDLARGPLLRATLVRLGAEDWIALLTLHHIVSDGWSLGILVREISALYGAAATGLPSPLPALPVQYADFAVWQRDWLSGAVLEHEIAFWRDQLRGAPPELRLPLDRPRPAVHTGRNGSLSCNLPSSLAAALRSLSRQQGSTMFMTLLAVFQTLLHRTTGQSDISVGTRIAGRNHLQIEGLIGFFLNSLVLRGDLADDPGFLALLARVRGMALAAYAHQDLPFEKLVEQLQPARDLARAPLFQVMFVLQNAPAGALAVSGLTFSRLEAPERGAAVFDLELTFAEAEDGLSGTLDYDRDLFDATTVARLSGHLASLARGIVADPRQRLSELPLMSEGERHQALCEWQGAPSAGPGPLVHELVAARALAAPGDIAVVFAGVHLTYGELDARADRLAGALVAAGVGPEVLVALLAARSPALLIAILAVYKAGGAYLPLDPQHPASRQRHLLLASGAALVLAESHLTAGLSRAGEEAGAAWPPILDLGGQLQAGAVASSPGRSAGGAAADNLAYVIYTSGSTGLPKGAMVTHGGMLNHLWAKVGDLGLERRSRVSQTASQCFDISVWQLLAPLVAGGSVHIADEETVHDPELLLRFVAREEISVLEVVPSLLRGMLDSPAVCGGAIDLSSLRWLIVTGEACSPELARRWFEVAPQVGLLNAYGPTECSDDVTHHALRRCAGGPSLTLPIGRPIANTRIYVLDRAWRTTAPGIAGELCVTGEGVGRGYLGDPARTAEVFIPDPWSGAPGSRAYRTGDRARHLPDGTLDFLGRLDHQLKVRGFRIEPGEIEALLVQHAGVREAAVRAWESHPGDLRLVAYLVTGEIGEPPVDALRAFLRERAPEYLMPSAFVYLEALPLTANGKLNREALPAPTSLGQASSRGAVAPRDETELRLLAIWGEVLGAPIAGVTEDFFALGGHSLLAVRLMARIEQNFGRKLHLSTIFQGSTVERLAAILRRPSGETVARQPLVRIQPHGSRRPFFCVHAVGGNVFSYVELARRLGPDQPFYGLQSPSSAGEPEATIEGMAARYLEAIREVQPEGPYLLGGWSMGGVVAFEMARQLVATGGEVALLALIDAPQPGAARSTEIDQALLIAGFARDLTGRELPDGERRTERDGAWVSRILSLAKENGALAAATDEADLLQLFEIFRRNVQAVQRYRPGFYPGRIEWLRAGATEAVDPAEGWAGLAAGGAGIHHIPGDHDSILAAPQVGFLAERLQALVDGRPDLARQGRGAEAEGKEQSPAYAG